MNDGFPGCGGWFEPLRETGRGARALNERGRPCFSSALSCREANWMGTCGSEAFVAIRGATSIGRLGSRELVAANVSAPHPLPLPLPLFLFSLVLLLPTPPCFSCPPNFRCSECPVSFSESSSTPMSPKGPEEKERRVFFFFVVAGWTRIVMTRHDPLGPDSPGEFVRT